MHSQLYGRDFISSEDWSNEELESALTHVLAEGAPPAPAELWVSVRTPEGERRRCWRSGFVRLASPLAEEPVPLGVGWLFQDVTESRQGEQEASLLRFRAQQLHRAARAAAECEDPAEAATVHLDFALAGFADHALIDRVADGTEDAGPVRLVRVAATPSGAPGPTRIDGRAGLPVRYGEGHPAVQCVERAGSVRQDACLLSASAASVSQSCAYSAWTTRISRNGNCASGFGPMFPSSSFWKRRSDRIRTNGITSFPTRGWPPQDSAPSGLWIAASEN